ncbi:hypothetical protein EPN44_08050 [bacterium]|nr:MAG: hypothetical protein EPN44_08050 [bacterium]
MAQAHDLANALNAVARSASFSNTQARATARKHGHVDWPATKAENQDFNPEVDGFETFVMEDGSRCAWVPGQGKYAGRGR